MNISCYLFLSHNQIKSFNFFLYAYKYIFTLDLRSCLSCQTRSCSFVCPVRHVYHLSVPAFNGQNWPEIDALTGYRMMQSSSPPSLLSVPTFSWSIWDLFYSVMIMFYMFFQLAWREQKKKKCHLFLSNLTWLLAKIGYFTAKWNVFWRQVYIFLTALTAGTPVKMSQQ